MYYIYNSWAPYTCGRPNIDGRHDYITLSKKRSLFNYAKIKNKIIQLFVVFIVSYYTMFFFIKITLNSI